MTHGAMVGPYLIARNSSLRVDCLPWMPPCARSTVVASPRIGRRSTRVSQASARRRRVYALAVVALAVPLTSLAQRQGNVPQIGLLIPETLSVEAARIDALCAGLRDH